MNLKSPQVISVEGSGHRIKGSHVESHKLSGSLTKPKNFGGKFQNMASENNGDQYYNKIKVVEVGSVLDDLKDENNSYDNNNLRCEPQFTTKLQRATFGGQAFMQKSIREMSPEGQQFNKTRMVLSQIEECLI